MGGCGQGLKGARARVDNSGFVPSQLPSLPVPPSQNECQILRAPGPCLIPLEGPTLLEETRVEGK